MRPNIDEYEDIEETKGTGGSRAMSWMVLAVAVGGFAALAYYAYNSGSRTAVDGEMIVVEADGAPIKEAPVDPEGEQFPNKDKTIYDVIAQDGQQQVEKLMPEPEKPVAAMNVEDSEDAEPVVVPPATTFVAEPTKATVAEPAKPVAAKVEPAKVAPQPVVEAKPVEKVIEPAKAEEKSYADPEMINEKSVTGVVEAPKPAPEKPKTEKPASASGGAYKIQLGAFKSEAEARGAWKKISGKFGLGGVPSIVKADVNGGTFYRLRTGSYASSADAKAACASMAGQACMAVK
jgi:cell division protein FtsN